MVTNRQPSTLSESMRINTSTIFEKIGRKDISLVKFSITKNASGRLLSHTTTTPLNIVGDLQFVTLQDKQWLSTGFAKMGDGVLYCKHSEDIDAEDIITVDGNTWEVQKQVEGETINGNMDYQAWIVSRREEG